MSEALAVKVETLERNNIALWAKHDECENERKEQALTVARLQGQANLLGTKIDTIEQSTAKIEAVVLKMSDKVDELALHDAKTSGFAVGAKELLWGAAIILGIVGTVLGFM